MTHRISVYWEVAPDQDNVEAFLFGMREELVQNCPEVICDVQAVVSDESNRELEQAIQRTVAKAKEARERDDAAMCAYLVKELLRIPASRNSEPFEIGASLCAVHGLEVLNGFDITVDAVEGAADAQAVVDELYIPLVLPLTSRAFPYRQYLAGKIGLCIVRGISATCTMLSRPLPSHAEMN